METCNTTGVYQGGNRCLYLPSILKMETAGFFENIGNHLKTSGYHYSEDKNKSFRYRESLQSRVAFS
jgi:hypothetical protein